MTGWHSSRAGCNGSRPCQVVKDLVVALTCLGLQWPEQRDVVKDGGTFCCSKCSNMCETVGGVRIVPPSTPFYWFACALKGPYQSIFRALQQGRPYNCCLVYARCFIPAADVGHTVVLSANHNSVHCDLSRWRGSFWVLRHAQ